MAKRRKTSQQICKNSWPESKGHKIDGQKLTGHPQVARFALM
jgi:hypothetical protein